MISRKAGMGVAGMNMKGHRIHIATVFNHSLVDGFNLQCEPECFKGLIVTDRFGDFGLISITYPLPLMVEIR